jgi:hypothetical protein
MSPTRTHVSPSRQDCNIYALFASMECPPTVVNELKAAIGVPRRHPGSTKTRLGTCQNSTLAGRFRAQ